MQQTETYKLNLIEKTDTFSPDPLNENMEKLETALDTKFAALDAGDAALDTRVTALEEHKLVLGSFNGTGSILTISLGFTPTVVIVQNKNGSCVMATKYSRAEALTITSDGFTVQDSTHNGNYTYNGTTCHYCAIL